MSEISDRQILDAFAEPLSRDQAFEMLVRKYQERLYWHIRKMVISHDDADDLLQNTFLRAFNGLESFRGDSQLFTWLYRIATNECLRFLNSSRKKLTIPIVNIEHSINNNLLAEPWFSGDRTQQKLHQALLTLPEKQRLVFNMKYFDEMKYEEISDILGTSVGALKASYHLAVNKIKEFLQQD